MRRLLITGATGLVGSHVAQRAVEQGWLVRALVRPESDTGFLQSLGVELSPGDMESSNALSQGLAGVTHIVHCAAKVGDWGKTEDYRAVNVRALEQLLLQVERQPLQRFVHLSSLGVYPARDHYGTDELDPISLTGLDGYTRTKAEAEQLVLGHIRDHKLPAVVLRPGFIYGPRDRTVLPQLLRRLKSRQVRFFGSGEQLMNNTFVGNLVDAIFLALDVPQAVGQVYNITDGRLVTKREFLQTVAANAGYAPPKRRVPLFVARTLVKVSETLARWRGACEAPLLSSARYKFLALNLDYCIDKARRELGYAPKVDFQEAMRDTVAWFDENAEKATIVKM